MFFVSEEFLRKHEPGEDFDQTIDKAIPVGHELFENSEGKGKRNDRKRRDAGQEPKRDSGQSEKGD